MKRRETIKTIIKELNGSETVIASTGLMSRELFTMHDNEQNFYMTGSMGLISSMGLGIAVSKIRKKIVVIDGDASLLMNFGSLATIGHFKPKNLLHIVLDNNVYDSCSGEKSISNTARFAKVAKIVGYRMIEEVSSASTLKRALVRCFGNKNGPIFLLVKTEPGGQRDLPRPLEFVKLTNRFRKFLS